MHINRRTILGVAATSAVLATPFGRTAAAGVPNAQDDDAPGYEIVRVRTVATPALREAVDADVLATFFPLTVALPGYRGYLLGNHLDDPTSNITLTLLAAEADGAGAGEMAQTYVETLDPRLTPETPFREQGPIRVFHTTTHAAADLPPFLNGCTIALRAWQTAPDADIEALLADVTAPDGLVSELAALPGFVFYLWMRTEDGLAAINLWETQAQSAAGTAAAVAWASANTVGVTTGEPTITNGTVTYADVVGFV